MKQEKSGEAIKLFKQELLEKVRKMSNKELRQALWEARKEVMARESVSLLTEQQLEQKFPEEIMQKKLLREEMFSRELERRGLLEWALKTGKNKG
ncbi:MAG: hypothetical protein GF308_11125 [Candidatus Heimdallarchaeota archaeon]|nr:hypothetical protein [Candidatus Heimdallarchaeota archaeon]